MIRKPQALEYMLKNLPVKVTFYSYMQIIYLRNRAEKSYYHYSRSTTQIIAIFPPEFPYFRTFHHS
jgi:hypothetical protein